MNDHTGSQTPKNDDGIRPIHWVLIASLALNLCAVNVIYHQQQRMELLTDFAEDAKARVQYLSATVKAGLLAVAGANMP